MKKFLLLTLIAFSLNIFGGNIAVINWNNVTMDNGLITASITGGRMYSLNQKGKQNLLITEDSDISIPSTMMEPIPQPIPLPLSK